MDLQKNELSLRNLEELCEKTSSHLAVIHRCLFKALPV
jgi:hypothetical protein